ncbi:hypothetical protein IMG5_133020 [Ichthyophthirius multifiliis]|uniref:B30.2/SPRY domain-containing protein n=1 Tax=Ichthyophthirius multifiliis TaxID=5932 RepID=G0QWK8_ICHMU|nr:hypothetical protein IMG5_133020 [Ichthyophthirius multifiliis]EGR30403.1 hypothetical protein IMG5_133020 [Ichthyophthirius multifiliis]|eukprot:XP_004031990.1 hypothetical protein IMG5_133020 [Ichthyophthirius multifiliis]
MFNQFRYLECQKGSLHQGELLNFICYDQSCNNKGIICSICRSELHQTHKTIPLKLFLMELTQKLSFINSKKSNNNLDYQLQQIDKSYQQILYNLKDTVQYMAQEIKKLEEEISKTIQSINEKITQNFYLSQNFLKVIECIKNGEYTEVNIFEKECKNIIQWINFQDNKNLEIDIKPEKFIHNFNQRQTESIQIIQKIKTQFSDQIIFLQSLFQKSIFSDNNQNLSIQQNFIFSDQLKTKSIILSDNKLIATQSINQDNDCRFALLEPKLSLNQQTKFAFTFKSLNAWIGIGICLRNILQKNNFKFDNINLGNGCYMISSNGQCWSHSSKEDNKIFKSFVFKQDDVVLGIYDPVNKQIRFKKNIENQIVSIGLDIPENEQIYICANICNKNDQVEILNDQNLFKENF